MKTRRLLAFAAAAGLLGCATKYETVTPELQASMMADLRAGKLNLDCGQKCQLTWVGQAAQIHALDISERWTDLAVRVMQIGYGVDLGYYYLGQAAQGLGYQKAAIDYYTYSLALATGQNPLLRCEAGQSGQVDPCQGVDLISSIPVLIQASRDQIARENAGAAQTVQRRKKPAPRPVQNASGGGSNWVAPPPPSDQGSGWAAPPPPQ